MGCIKKCISLFTVLIWLCLGGSNLKAQVFIKGIITDTCFKPIQYASVGYFNNRVGSISDSDGIFKLHKIMGDSVKISFVGFHPQIVVIEDTTKFLNIQLEPKMTSLNEVLIKSRRKTNKSVVMGHLIKERVTTYSSLLHKDLVKATFIPNVQNIEGYIDEVLFELYNYRNKPTRLRIRVHSAHPISGIPDEDLLITDNILEPKKFRKNNSFSIKKHNIQMPRNGIWISFEWLPLYGELTQKDIPWIIGNDKADRPYMMDNYKDIEWKRIAPFSSHDRGYLVLNVSVKVSY